MTIDEAIKHCLEVAEQNETQADKIGGQLIGSAMDKRATDCRECAADHRQLAEWLKELKSLRKKAEHLTEWNRKLIDYKNKIICKWGKSQEELQEAKRLLKSTIDEWHIVCEWGDCSERCDWYVNGKCTQEWSGKAEALKLIEDESDGI